MPDMKTMKHHVKSQKSQYVLRVARLRFAIGLAIIILIIGCAQTEQARKVETSGFIRDYSLLRPGGEGEALLVYKNPQSDFSQYRSVYVEPVVALLSEQSSVPPEELEKLGGDLRAKVIWELKEEDFIVVPKLVPGALKIELALTEAVPADVGMVLFTNLFPPAGVVSGAATLATGTRAFVGRASVEAKITDADTGQLLAAAVDRRMGARTLEGSLSSWEDVHEAFDYWAAKLAQRLREWRAIHNPPAGHGNNNSVTLAEMVG